MKDFKRFSGIVLFCLAWGVARATSPLGRKQLLLVSDGEMDQMGAQAFQQLKTTQKADQDPATKNYIQCIVGPLTQAARHQTSVEKWDVVVFEEKSANAFALPGGKIGVHTGILKVAKTPDQLAAVLGHEIGHVIARHGAERVSQETSAQLGMAVLGSITPNNPNKNLLMGLIGVGTQVGVLLPFSRTQESEADLIGLDLMARAGFDPRESVALWKNMISATGGAGPPQWLSTHPASENRIQDLQAHMSGALTQYEAARASGHAPACR